MSGTVVGIYRGPSSALPGKPIRYAGLPPWTPKGGQGLRERIEPAFQDCKGIQTLMRTLFSS